MTSINPNSTTLIIHVGSGKTGTTSIQRALHTQTTLLQKNSAKYLGLMLEKNKLLKFNWQIPTTVNDLFYTLPSGRKSTELYEALASEISNTKKEGIQTLIWSNESLFDHPNDLIEPLTKLRSDGVTIKLVLYLRKYEDWAKSAYIQWGIKHKTYTGPLQTFDEWIKHHKPCYINNTKTLNQAFGDSLLVRNYDACEDVVADFFETCGLPPPEIKKIRSNESPDNIEILLRALFNSQYKEKVLPSEFDKLFAEPIKNAQESQGFISTLLPSTESIASLSDSVADDRVNINNLLQIKNQPPIKRSSPEGVTPAINESILLFTLTKLVVKQANDIKRLQEEIQNVKLNIAKD